MIHIPANLVTPENLRTSIDDHLDRPPNLLPSSAVDPALHSVRDELVDWTHGQLVGTYSPPLEEVVAVSKARHGVRPVAVWDLPSALLYRGTVERLSPNLDVPNRGRKAWRAFRRKPLGLGGNYIVSTDIASCYSLIDHQLLADELILQTGEANATSLIVDLLCEVSGRKYGLPQQSHTSDILAESFLNRLERAVVRRGLIVTRFNDDFRINCDDWSGVVRSIEIMSEETRRLGLILNDSKTLTWGTTTYEESLDEADALREQIADEAELDLTNYQEDAYDGTVTRIEPDPDDVNALAAARILDRWREVAGRGKIDEARRTEHRAVLELVPFALSELSEMSWEPDGTLDTTMHMLRYEQTLTPSVCRYLITRQDEDALLSAFDSFIASSPYLTGWQRWWMQQPLARLDDFAEGREGATRLAWTRQAFTDAAQSPILRVHAAMTLARHGGTTQTELLAVYDRSSPVVRPVLAAAIGLLKPEASVADAVTGDSKLNEWAYLWARQHA